MMTTRGQLGKGREQIGDGPQKENWKGMGTREQGTARTAAGEGGGGGGEGEESGKVTRLGEQ